MGCTRSSPGKEVIKRLDIQVKLDLRELIDQTDRAPKFSFCGLKTEAKCVKCYDADTVHMVFLYNDTFYKFNCRLLGIDAAELRTVNPEEKRAAQAGRDYLASKILNQIVRIECFNFDKYGRILVKIYKGKKDINHDLVKKGHAYVYEGKTKKEFSEWYYKK